MPGRYHALLSLVLLLLISAACAATDSKAEAPASEVLHLDTDSFADTIERQTAPALLKFVIPDCPVCKTLATEFDKVASNLKDLAPVASVDCTNVGAVRTCRSFGAHKFPKVLVFKPGSRVNPYTGGAMKDFDEYTGSMSAKSLITAVTDKLDTSQITNLQTPEQQKQFLQSDPKLAKVLLFTDKPSSTVLYKGLSWAFSRRLMFAEVRPTGAEAKALTEAYGVTSYPTLLVVKPDGSTLRYEGSLKAPQLRAFLEEYATKEPLPDGSAASKQQGTADPFGQLHEVVLHPLTPGNLTDIDRQDDMWLLAFYASTDDNSCASQLDGLQKLLVEVQGIVSYGSLDTKGAEPELLKPYGLDTEALATDGCSVQLVRLPYGDDKQSKGEYVRWTGGLDDAKALQDWILKAVPDFTTALSSESEAQHFLDATAADLPKLPKAASKAERQAPIGKVLLFTSKEMVPGIYKALAMQFAGKSRMLFAWSRATVDGPGLALMQKMNVRKAPAMAALFPLPPKPLGSGEEQEAPNRPRDNMAMQQYMGPLKYQKMLGWISAISALTGMAYKSHAGATKGPSPEDMEIRSHTQLQTACYDKPGLCLLTLLDGRSESTNKHKDTIQQAAAALSGQPVNWVVVDVSRQSSFRRAYGFTADQLPALVALSTRRMRFAQGAAPFSVETTKQLVSKVLAGTAITLPLPDLPKLVDGGEPEEASAADVEDEFNLDEIMAEEVKELYRKEERLQQAEEELKRESEAKKKAKKKKESKKKSKSKKKKAKQKTTSGSSTAAAKDEL